MRYTRSSSIGQVVKKKKKCVEKKSDEKTKIRCELFTYKQTNKSKWVGRRLAVVWIKFATEKQQKKNSIKSNDAIYWFEIDQSQVWFWNLFIFSMLNLNFSDWNKQTKNKNHQQELMWKQLTMIKMILTRTIHSGMND